MNEMDLLVTVMKEMKKITADYGLSDVLLKLKIYERANMDFYFINAWESIPANCLYKNFVDVLCNCERSSYRQMFKPRLIEKLRKVNKHATVDNPLLQSRLDADGLLTVYHGHAKKTMRASYSWTTEPEIAHFFGCRNSKIISSDGFFVVTGKVFLKDIIAHIMDRGEEEIVVLNKDVKHKRKEYFSRSETDGAYRNFDDVTAMIAKRRSQSDGFSGL